MSKHLTEPSVEPNRNKWEPLIRNAAHRIADLPLSLVGESAEIVIRDIVREVVGDCVAVSKEPRP